MHFLAELPQQCRRSLSPSGERTMAFVFLSSIIMAATFSLGRSLGTSIWSIFPLCMESNTLEKSKNNSISSRSLNLTILRIIERFHQLIYIHIHIYIYRQSKREIERYG